MIIQGAKNTSACVPTKLGFLKMASKDPTNILRLHGLALNEIFSI